MTEQAAKQSRLVDWFMLAVLLATLVLGLFGIGLWMGVLWEMIA